LQRNNKFKGHFTMNIVSFYVQKNEHEHTATEDQRESCLLDTRISERHK